MIDFSNAKEHEQRFIGNIYDYISDIDIYTKALGYIPNTKTFYRSPFEEDKNPSLRFYQSNGRLRYKCFSSDKGGDAVSLVADLNKCSYKEAIDLIISNNNIRGSVIPNNITRYFTKKETIIEVILFDKEPESFYAYWNKFGVSKEILTQYNIRAAKEVWLNDSLYHSYTDKDISIRYLINGRYKIYKPLSEKKNRWISTTKHQDIQGYDQLPFYGDLLIISKAMKDVLIWRSLGYNAIALCSETAKLKEEQFKELSSRFNKIVSVLDNDKAGIDSMNWLKDTYNIPFSHIPIDCEHKDIGELTENNLKVLDYLKL